MTGKIFKAILLVAIAVLLSCFALIFGVLYDLMKSQITDELQSAASYISEGISNEGMDYFSDLKVKHRITWIASDGTVLFDNQTGAASMENHTDREEVQAAILEGSGESTRYSDTFGEKTIYYALRLDDGSILRVSRTQHTVTVLILGMLTPVCIIFVSACVLSGLLASALSKRIVRPINAIDLEHPEQSLVYDELSPLLSKIYHQNRIIDRQVKDLQRKQAEFTAITENMCEGFLVIDKYTELLSYNSSALRLLGAEVPDGRHSLLELNRSEEFRKAIELSLQGERNEQLMNIGERTYQLIANPVQSGSVVVGSVIVILDVTEREAREQLRREFTANVSHELKTPLTSISGTAEMIKNGFVKPEDIAHFAANIYDEAQRLIALIGDILHLSQMDEKSEPLCSEDVDLYELCEDVLQRLKNEASKKSVSLELQGEHAVIKGTRQILDEVIYNLCDNAIKYNVQNGSVTVSVNRNGKQTVLSVKDTGIGIDPAHQERVFERFYRVDKSHSKEIGGTGLGLSIVKHGVAYHNASIALTSELNCGTTVTITF